MSDDRAAQTALDWNVPRARQSAKFTSSIESGLLVDTSSLNSIKLANCRNARIPSELQIAI
jgi:hypothetical protein